MHTPYLALLATLTFVACGRSEPPPPEEHPDLTVQRAGSYGSENDEVPLSSVHDVAVSQEGSVYASEPVYGHLLMYDAGGRFVRTIGRKGEGPGEMMIPGALWWRGDTLLVMDYRLGVHFFAADGSFLTRLNPRVPAQPGSIMAARPFVPLADGTFAAFAPVPNSQITRGRAEHQVWLKVDRDGSVLDTLWQESLAGRVAPVDVGQGRPAHSIAHPVPWNPLVAVPPDGSSLVTLERRPAPDGGYTVTRLDLGGDTVARRKVATSPRRLHGDAMDSLASVAGRRLAGGGITEAAATSAVRAQVDWPDYLPPATDLHAAMDGTVWVRREEASQDSIRWDVLNADLVPLGAIALPADLDVKTVVSGDESNQSWAMYGIEVNELDVPSIIEYVVSEGTLTPIGS